MYLEGSDQHRGWFHSSLLESCGTRGRAPYDAVLTHGFVLDEKGQKMSKSLGNVVAPQTVIKDAGADILRLWVAASDYSDDLRIGPEILKTFVETYRKLRNTIRWMLGSLAHYDPAATVGFEAMGELERLMLHRLAELDGEIREAYEQFDYKRVVARLSAFLNTDLSAFYFDIRKDTLYCEPPSSEKRRAALEAIEQIFRGVTLWLAPILAFTSEEAWLARYPDAVSVHLEAFPDIPPSWRDDALAEKWEKIRRVRSVVTGALGDRAGAKTHRLVARGRAEGLYRRCGLARASRIGRFRRNLHHLGYRDRGGRGPGGGVPARRRSRRRRRAGSRAGQEMREIVENFAACRERSRISGREPARRAGLAGIAGLGAMAMKPRLLGFWRWRATLAADQANKLWLIFVYGIEARQPVRLAPFFDVIYAKNPGISYSLFPAQNGTERSGPAGRNPRRDGLSGLLALARGDENRRLRPRAHRRRRARQRL